MPTSVRLPVALEERLSKVVTKSGKSRAQFIREALDQHIDKMENLVAATEMLARIQRGEERTPEHEEILRKIGWHD